MRDETRAATALDVEALAALEHEARATLIGARGGAPLLAEQPAVGDWAVTVADPAQRVFVATIDDVVLGYLQLSVVGDVGVVRQAYVVEGARELGFGSELLDLAMAAATASGCRAIEGFSLPGDRDTKNLFERAGITARKIIVRREL